MRKQQDFPKLAYLLTTLSARCHVPENSDLYSYCLENLKFHGRYRFFYKYKVPLVLYQLSLTFRRVYGSYAMNFPCLMC